MAIVSVECLGPLSAKVTDASYAWWVAAEYELTLEGGEKVKIPHFADGEGGFVNKAYLTLYLDLRDWIRAGGVPTQGGVPRIKPARHISELERHLKGL